MNIKNWLLIKLLPKPTPKLITMDERYAWEIYQQMARIPRIKELFELRRQVAYIQCARNKEQFNSEWGRIQDIEEILENMEVSNQKLEELQVPITEVTQGYKSSIES